ncbi:MAG: hypothetical protein U1E76_25210 [Planctomycetota bacterium]
MNARNISTDKKQVRRLAIDELKSLTGGAAGIRDTNPGMHSLPKSPPSRNRSVKSRV